MLFVQHSTKDEDKNVQQVTLFCLSPQIVLCGWLQTKRHQTDRVISVLFFARNLNFISLQGKADVLFFVWLLSTSRKLVL